MVPTNMLADAPLLDGHGRTIRYPRVSVTDRCHLRRRHCMAEQMTFLPLTGVQAQLTARYRRVDGSKTRIGAGDALATARRMSVTGG